jgi:hypothetical protein
VEIGPEGWTPTQQPPECFPFHFSHFTTPKLLKLPLTRKGNAEILNRTGNAKLLVEIGPEGWTPTQLPPECFPFHFSHFTTPKLLKLPLTRKGNAEILNRTGNAVRKHLANRRPKD